MNVETLQSSPRCAGMVCRQDSQLFPNINCTMNRGLAFIGFRKGCWGSGRWKYEKADGLIAADMHFTLRPYISPEAREAIILSSSHSHLRRCVGSRGRHPCIPEAYKLLCTDCPQDHTQMKWVQ